MKQPENYLEFFTDDGDLWIDVMCGGDDGGYCQVGIGRGRHRETALRMAIKRLKRLTNDAEKLLGSVL